MTLETQCYFAEIYSRFKTCTHKMKDVGYLIQNIRDYKHDISDAAKVTLLEIPLCVLNERSEISRESAWAKKNASYFAGNANSDPYGPIFASGDYTLETMYEFLLTIVNDSKKLNSDFLLRNPEVTLRDDVVPKYEDQFKSFGLIFARTMEKAFEL